MHHGVEQKKSSSRKPLSCFATFEHVKFLRSACRWQPDSRRLAPDRNISYSCLLFSCFFFCRTFYIVYLCTEASSMTPLEELISIGQPRASSLKLFKLSLEVLHLPKVIHYNCIFGQWKKFVARAVAECRVHFNCFLPAANGTEWMRSGAIIEMNELFVRSLNTLTFKLTILFLFPFVPPNY